MLYDSLTVQEVVDSESAAEFLKEATKLASSQELEGLARLLEAKQKFFETSLSKANLEVMTEVEFSDLLSNIFSISRKSRKVMRVVGLERFRWLTIELLHGEEDVGSRLQAFVSDLSRNLDQRRAINLGTELLHYYNPTENGLWTNWIWDPSTGSGALQMVLQEQLEIKEQDLASQYRSVSSAIRLIAEAGYSRSISRNAQGPLGVGLFLACVHAVYMYTVFKLKLSNEFNRILPELPELVARLLGVRNMEVSTYV